VVAKQDHRSGRPVVSGIKLIAAPTDKTGVYEEPGIRIITIKRGFNMDWFFAFLQSMIGDEKAAQAKYAHAAELADTPELKAMFQQLHDEEVVHQRILEGWIDTLQKAQK